MSTLERPEDHTLLPASAPSVLEKRQETDAPQTLERPRPQTSAPKEDLSAKPKAGYIPPKDLEVNSLFDEVVAGFNSYVSASRGNRKMAESRQAELDQDYERQALLKEEANSFYVQAQKEAPSVTTVGEVDDLESSVRYGLGLAGQALPSVGMSMLGGFGGSVIGRTARAFVNPTLKRVVQPAGAFIGATGIVYPDVKGSIVAQQENDPTIAARPVEQRERAATLTALGSSALEGLVPAAISKRAVRMGDLRRTPINRYKTAAQDIIGEGVTEGSQLALEETAHELQNPDRPNAAGVNDYLDSIFGGLAGGVAAHGIGRGFEGLDKLISIDTAPPNAFGILGGNLGTGSVRDKLVKGVGKNQVDAFETFLPSDVMGVIRGFNQPVERLVNLSTDPEMAKRFLGFTANQGQKESVEMLHKVQAVATLAHMIENPDSVTTPESNRVFNEARERAAKLLFPDDENGIERIDSLIEHFTPEEGNVTQELSDKTQPSERNLDMDMEDLSDDEEVLRYQEGLFPTGTSETNAFGDPSGLNLSVPDQAIEFVFNVTDQQARKGEDDVLYRPAFAPSFKANKQELSIEEEDSIEAEARAAYTEALKKNPNTTETLEGIREAFRESSMVNGNVYENPWETAKLENELNKLRATRGVDPSVVPVTRMLDAKNLDPVIYAEELLADIEERITRNRQDPQAVLEEKGVDTDGSPYPQEQVLSNLNLQAENLSNLLDAADSADGAKNLYNYLKDNYKVGAVDSLPISRELSVSEGDVQGFRLLATRYKDNDKEMKKLKKLMLTPVKLKRDADGNVTDEIEQILEPIVSESVINHMRTKGKSRANSFMSSSKDGVSDRQLFSEGLAGMMAAGIADGFLDPESKTPKVYKTERMTRDKNGNPVKVAENKPGIPLIQLKRFPYKSLGKKRGDFFQKVEAVQRAVKAAVAAIKDPLFDVPPEDFKKRVDLLGTSYANAYDYLIDLVGARPGISRKNLLEEGFKHIASITADAVQGQVNTEYDGLDINATRYYTQLTTKFIDNVETFDFKEFVNELVKTNRKQQEDITQELLDPATTAERKEKLKSFEKELIQEQLDLSKAKVTGLARVREGDNTIRNFKDPATAIEFILRFDNAIKKVSTLERNYIADTATLLSIINKTYKSAKKAINQVVELHFDDKPRTIESGAAATALRNDLILRKEGIAEVKSLLLDKRSAADEAIQNTGREDIQEGGYSELSAQEKSDEGYTPFQDSDAEGKETTYDPAAQPLDDSTLRARRTQERNKKKLAERDKNKIFVDKPDRGDFFKDGMTPLDTARTPPGILTARKALRKALEPVRLLYKKGPNIGKEVWDKDGKRVFEKQTKTVTAQEQKARDTMRVFLTDKSDLGTMSTGMAALNDLESTDLAYLLLDNIKAVTDKRRTRSKYLIKLMEANANLFLAAESFSGKDKQAQLDEFHELMERNGYEQHPTIKNLFISTNTREYKRSSRAYEAVVEAWQQQQDSIEEVALNPDHPENKQTQARHRHFGGKQNKIGRKHKKRAEKAKKGEELDTIVDNVKEEIKRNREETALAIEALTDFRTEAARDLFAAYIKNLDFSEDALQARKDLHRTIHGNKRVVARMMELLKENPLSKADQKKLATDPDFATAVAFQMWANGDLDVGTTAQGWFKKIVTHLMNVLGITLSHQNGEAIFTMFKNGDLTESSNVRNVYRQNRRGLDNAYRDLSKGYNSFAKRLVRSSTDVLRQTRIPELLELANLFQVAEVDDKNPNLGFLPKRKQQIGKWNTEFSNIIDNYTDAELEAGFIEVRSNKVPKTKAGKAILDFQTKFYKYLEGTGVQVTAMRDGKIKTVPIGERKRRAPIVFSAKEINKDRVGFVKELTEAGLSVEQAESVLQAALWNDGMIDFSDSRHDLGRPPNTSHLFSGLLDVVTEKNRAKFTKFEKSDPVDIFHSFIRQGVHRAESTRAFGVGNEKIELALQVARAKGMDNNQLDFIRNRTIPALMGTLSYNLDPKIRKLYGGILTIQNLAVLPLALFASIVDIAGISLRTGDMTDAWRAFKQGTKGIVNSMDDDTNLAQLIGIIDAESLLDRVGDTYNELIDSPLLRKINNKFFKLNGLEGWTKGMRVAAMRAGISYLSDHRDNAAKLADIGLVKGDLSFNTDGILDVENNEKVQDALFKFVDSAVLRPSASHRPAWGSDPRFLLVWHLKQFTFSFHHVFLRRLTTELTKSNPNYGVLVPYLSMIPIMLASDALRNVIAPSNAYDAMTFPQLVARSVQRSSIAGIGTFGFDVATDVDYDEFPGTSLLGPTFDSADKFLDAGAKEGVTLLDAMHRLTPGYALTKSWLQ